MTSTRRRDDRGAVAVMVALLCIVLFTLSAFVIDLGNAFVRKRDVQAQADFAALAGGGQLATEKSGAVPPSVVDAVRDYLNTNHPQDDKGVTPVVSSQLIDANLSNGEVRFANGGLQVVAPKTQVDFGFAEVMGPGHDKVDVNATATVGVFSPKAATMPMFAVSGCDWGPQTITDPATGHVTPSGPTLYEGADGVPDSNKASLTASTSALPNPSPSQVIVNPASGTVTIKGSLLANVSKVGFFLDGNGVPGPAPIEYALPSPNTNANQVTVPIPLPGVTDAQNLWWVRVWGPAGGGKPDQWSSVKSSSGDLNTVPFRVGTPYLHCAGISNEGNYGTLKLPRNDGTNAANWLSVNIAKGLQAPEISLSIYPGNNAGSPNCDPSTYPSVYSTTTGTPTLRPSTNCVDTDTGLAANATTAGLITGASTGAGTVPGRLDVATMPGCAPDGTSNQRTVALANGSTKTINNDILTCFFKAGTTATVGDVGAETYTYDGGKPVISADIYKSPRFFYQPVLGVDPSCGGCSHYKIVDMRPAFVTDQPPAATKSSPQVGPDNGVSMVNGQVSELRVVFLNFAAIETPEGGEVMDWIGGSTPKSLRMID